MKKLYILIILGLVPASVGIFFLKKVFTQYERLVNSPWVSKIHKITYLGDVVVTYSYEKPVENGRLLSITTSDNSFSITFDYAAHTATKVMGGTTTVIPLTAQGFESSPGLTIDPLSDDPSPITGYCTLTNDGSSVPHTRVYNGGNLVREYRQRADGTFQNDYSYTYTSDFCGEERFLGLSTKSTNWIRTQTDNTIIPAPPLPMFTFSYTYDAFHRVKTQTRKNNQTNTSEVLIKDIEYYAL